MFSSRHFAVAGLIGLAAAWSVAAQAQAVYRIVGPDGRVTFSDQPPPEPAGRGGKPAAAASPGGTAQAGGGSPLPYELRQVATRYPVTLYAAPNCAPCDAGRSFLNGRGVPFTEKTVTTPQDVEALNRLSGGYGSVPALSIGGQQLKGYSEAEWAQFLDAAGYPRTSQLPPGYRAPAASPLVMVQQPPAPATRPAAPQPVEAAAQTPPPAAGPAPSNPAGIRF